MRNLSTSANVLNNIFHPIEDETQIVIHFSCCKSTNGNRFDDDFQIQSVNGHRDHHEYKNHIAFLFFELLQNIIDKNDSLKNGENIVFLPEAMKRIKALKSTIRFERDRHWNSGTPGLWVFSHPEFSCMEDTVLPRYYHDRVVYKASRFALVWKESINHILNKLSTIETYCEYFSKNSGQTGDQIANKKLLLNVSVAIIACFWRGMHEIKLVESKNKSELCRMLVDFFQTMNQASISQKSLKNNFDYPTLAAIESCIIHMYNIIAFLNSLKAKMGK